MGCFSFPAKVHSRPLTQHKKSYQLFSCKGSQPPPHTTKREQACPFQQKFTAAPSHNTEIVISFCPVKIHSCPRTQPRDSKLFLSYTHSQPTPHTTQNSYQLLSCKG